MKTPIGIIFLATLFHGGYANAGFCTFPSYEGPFWNVSAAGNASQNSPIIVCTMVQEWAATSVATAIFAESTTGDAVLEVKYNQPSFPVRTSDNWKESVPADFQQTLKINLREPARPTDAAVVLTSDPSTARLGNQFGMCAYGYPKEGSAWVSVSISSLGASKVANTDCYSLPKDYFQHN